jgi:hypothetical protein
MRDLDNLADTIGDALAEQVLGLFTRLERDMADKLAAATPKDALIDRDGALVLTYGDGSTKSLGRVVGLDGVNGKDGVDGKDALDGLPGKDGKDGLDGQPGKAGEPGPIGLGFDDLDVALGEDGRTVVLSFERGDTRQTFELAFPLLVYRGVFEGDRTYEPGDVCTFGGSAWVCNAMTTEKPGEAAKAWTLAVKRGRDGKDFAGPQLRTAI